MVTSTGEACASRHLSLLAGAFNFRDLGGLPTQNGRRTRRGRLFRSDTLQAVTPDDVARLSDVIRLEAIVDLRLVQEAAEEGRGPLAGLPQIAYVNMPLAMASQEGLEPGEVLKTLYGDCLASLKT